jgi:hypothetical protein
MRRKKMILGLLLAGLLILAVAGAVLQLVRGQRPALLAT